MDEVVRVQERNYCRDDVDAPVVVAVPRHASFPSRLIDPCAGGASIQGCPETDGLRHGQRLALTFGLPTGDQRLPVTARLIRRSQGLHLRFDPMSDRMQDGIMRFVQSKAVAQRAI